MDDELRTYLREMEERLSSKTEALEQRVSKKLVALEESFDVKLEESFTRWSQFLLNEVSSRLGEMTNR